MQVMLESDDIAEIVDISIENALAPIRLENRRLLSMLDKQSSLIGELQLTIDEQKKHSLSLSDTVNNIKIPEQKSYDSVVENLDRKLTSCVSAQDFLSLQEQAFTQLNKLKEEIIVIKELRAIPGKDGLPGRDGERGKDGTDVNIDDVKSFIIDEMKKIPRPIDGKDGESIDFDNLRLLVEKEVGKIPRPKDGINLTIDDISPFVISYINEKFNSISAPKDGKDGVGLAGAIINRDGELIITCSNGMVIPLGNVVGRDGNDVSDKSLERLSKFEVRLNEFGPFIENRLSTLEIESKNFINDRNTVLSQMAEITTQISDFAKEIQSINRLTERMLTLEEKAFIDEKIDGIENGLLELRKFGEIDKTSTLSDIEFARRVTVAIES